MVERVGGKLFIMAVTATRIFEFCGATSFASVFEQLRRCFSPLSFFVVDVYFAIRYDNKAVPFHELPGSSSGHAELHLLRRSKDGQAVAFAWMTEAGVFHGSLKLGPEMNPGDSAMVKVS